MIVVDTNIIAHYWLPSDQKKLSFEVYKQDSEWVAPLLWASEFRNVVSLYLRKEVIDFNLALVTLQESERFVKGREFRVETLKVLNYINKSVCSSYDCEFVSLAADLSVPLVTFDKKILREFSEIAIHPLQFIN